MIGRETRVLLRHYLEQGMSKAAIARQVGVSRRTVYRWIVSGQLDRELDNEAMRYGPRRPQPSRLDTVVVPVFWTRGRPKHQAALRLSFSRARAGVRYPCRWRSQPVL